MTKTTAMAFATAAAVLALSGCATITMTKSGTEKTSSAPAYQDSKAYFVAGLIGEHSIDVKKVCNGGDAKQLQSQQTFVDGLLGAVTLFIYTPRTAKVWCEEKA